MLTKNGGIVATFDAKLVKKIEGSIVAEICFWVEVTSDLDARRTGRQNQQGE